MDPQKNIPSKHRNLRRYDWKTRELESNTFAKVNLHLNAGSFHLLPNKKQIGLLKAATLHSRFQQKSIERKLCFFKSDLAQPRVPSKLENQVVTLDLMSGNCLPKLSSYMKSGLITLLPIIMVQRKNRCSSNNYISSCHLDF